jgi:hypothetical protein
VVDRPGQLGWFAAAGPAGVLEGVEGQVGAQVRGRAPAGDAAGEQVGDEGDVDEPGPGRDVGDVGDPRWLGAVA